MTTVNIHAAKTQLSRLIDAATSGEDIVIARAGRPVARLVPIDPPELGKRKLGTLNGRFRLQGFDAPLPDDILDAFEGR